MNENEKAELLRKYMDDKSSDYIKTMMHEIQRGPFLQISYNLLNNERFLNEFFYTKRSRLYFLMRRYIIRKWISFDGISEIYWRKGLLACGLKTKRMCNELDMPESTLRDQINRMEKEGIILVDRYDASEVDDNKPRQIYILGVRENKFERYFIDDVYLRNIKPEVTDDDD